MGSKRLIGDRFAGALALALLMAVSGCTAASPSATPPATASVGASLAAAAPSIACQTVASGWSPTGPMIEARTGHTATHLLDGTVLVAGGDSGDGAVATAELYDPACGTWTATGGMIEARTDHTATLLPDGTVLVASGFILQQSSGDEPVTAERYDPGSGTWTATGEISESRLNRTHHTATLLLDGRVLVVGGFSFHAADALASAELYDPASGIWAATGEMHEARSGHTATLLPDGKVLVVGGANVSTGLGGALASAELYDPASGIWSATGNMTIDRQFHTATLMPDGTVLVAGGANSGGPAELYNPDSGIWTPTGNMIEVRFGHTATLLSDGTVLVACGAISGSPAAELYGPRRGTWTEAGNMIDARARAGHTATLLRDGRVLVAGGGLASAELYNGGNGP